MNDTYKIHSKMCCHAVARHYSKIIVLIIISFVINSEPSFAQTDTTKTHDHSKMMMEGMNMAEEGTMSSSLSLNLPMSRDGSGTSWQPDESPMMMYSKRKGNTSFIFHGAFFLRYTSQDLTKQGNRGGNKFDAPNWMMFMLTQKLSAKDLFAFLSMLSLDRLTEGGNGYPLLLQSGESFNGVPLVDRQHPHDLFAELAAAYTHSFTKDLDLTSYFGYPGEPALGPVVFMHRLSARNNPDATLGHHWQDATHITFGVATFGLRYKIIKAEGSIFTGREPDESRYDFNRPRFDSYSYRLSANPNQNFSLQFSQGFIHSPEVLEPEMNITRTTTSMLHAKSLQHGKYIATSFVWGMNHNSTGENLNSFLVESNLKLASLGIYARYEFVQKDADDLLLLHFEDTPTFNLKAYTLGVNKVLFTYFNTDLALGLQSTINFPDENLKRIYGNNPLAVEVFLKIAPASMMTHSTSTH